jgi:hypothetical protein
MGLIMNKRWKENLEVFKARFAIYENAFGDNYLLLDNIDDDALIKKGYQETSRGKGHFAWYCLPGCLPDSEPFGPYDSRAQCLADMKNMFGND